MKVTFEEVPVYKITDKGITIGTLEICPKCSNDSFNCVCENGKLLNAKCSKCNHEIEVSKYGVRKSDEGKPSG